MVDLGGIVIATGHVVHVLNGPPVIGAAGSGVDMRLLLDTTEQCQAPVRSHSGQVELQLVQEVTRPEEIWVGLLRTTGALLLQLPGK